MSANDPITTTFRLQRESIRQFQTLLQASVEFQQAVVEFWTQQLTAQETLADQQVEASRRLVETSLDAAESMTDSDLSEVRATVEESFDAASELQDDSWESARETVAEGADIYDEAADEYLQQADSSFDAFLDVHEQVETQVTEATAAVEGSVPEPAE
jgi:hypothetical protein